MQNTAKQNYPGLVASYDTQPGNEVGLLYNAPDPTLGVRLLQNYQFTMERTQTWANTALLRHGQNIRQT